MDIHRRKNRAEEDGMLRGLDFKPGMQVKAYFTEWIVTMRKMLKAGLRVSVEQIEKAALACLFGIHEKEFGT